MAAARQSRPKPSEFFGAAWRTAKRVPGVFVIRVGYDLFAAFFRIAILFVLGLPFVAHFAAHTGAGSSPWTWPDSVLAAASRPEAILALAGVAFTGWALLFAAESLAAAGIWGAVTEVLAGRDTTKFGTVFATAVRRFPDALPQRFFASCADLTLAAVTVGTCISAYASARWVSHWADSAVGAPAAVWGFFLALLACSAIVIRLTVEFVAAPLFLDDVSLGEAMRRAAETVVSHPVFVYRLFIVSAGILVVPLFAYWFAIIFQNVAIELEVMVSTAMMIRFAAELTVMVGLAAFIVMLNTSFFTYYAWWTGDLPDEALAAPASSDEVPSLGDLLPEEYPAIVDVDELLGSWSGGDTLPASTPDGTAESRPVESPPSESSGPFDLDAILAKAEEE